MPTYKLTYFPITGLGEPIRSACALGGIPLEDERIAGADWGARKAESPYGQMPILTVGGDDGTTLVMAQAKAILRYLGKLGSYEGKPLYSADAMEAYRCDEVIDLVDDMRGPIVKTFAIQDQAEKEAARAALIAPDGAMTPWIQRLDKRLGMHTWAAGESPSIADCYVVSVCLMIQQPTFIDGFPADTFANYPNITKLIKQWAALPPLAAYYKDADGIRAGFKAA